MLNNNICGALDSFMLSTVDTNGAHAITAPVYFNDRAMK